VRFCPETLKGFGIVSIRIFAVTGVRATISGYSDIDAFGT
jgi:hypothetical protein